MKKLLSSLVAVATLAACTPQTRYIEKIVPVTDTVYVQSPDLPPKSEILKYISSTDEDIEPILNAIIMRHRMKPPNARLAVTIARYTETLNDYYQDRQATNHYKTLSENLQKRLGNMPTDTVYITNTIERFVTTMQEHFVPEGQLFLRYGENYYVLPDASMVCEDQGANVCMRVEDIKSESQRNQRENGTKWRIGNPQGAK